MPDHLVQIRWGLFVEFLDDLSLANPVLSSVFEMPGVTGPHDLILLSRHCNVLFLDVPLDVRLVDLPCDQVKLVLVILKRIGGSGVERVKAVREYTVKADLEITVFNTRFVPSDREVHRVLLGL